MKTSTRLACIGLLALSLLSRAAFADDSSSLLSEGSVFTEQDGASLYRAACQACHMEAGQGALGAGRYPALSENARLSSAAYPIYNVLHGRGGMPSFATVLTDRQVAEVVNFVRTHWGNAYRDPVSAADVRKLR